MLFVQFWASISTWDRRMRMFWGHNMYFKEPPQNISVLSSPYWWGPRTLQNGVESQTSQNHLPIYWKKNLFEHNHNFTMQENRKQFQYVNAHTYEIEQRWAFLIELFWGLKHRGSNKCCPVTVIRIIKQFCVVLQITGRACGDWFEFCDETFIMKVCLTRRTCVFTSVCVQQCPTQWLIFATEAWRW